MDGLHRFALEAEVQRLRVRIRGAHAIQDRFRDYGATSRYAEEREIEAELRLGEVQSELDRLDRARDEDRGQRPQGGDGPANEEAL